jgi:hypothetical protein
MCHKPDYSFYTYYLLTKVQGCACVNARDLSRIHPCRHRRNFQHYSIISQIYYAIMTWSYWSTTKNLEKLSLEPSLSAIYSSCHNNPDLWDRVGRRKILTAYHNKCFTIIVWPFQSIQGIKPHKCSEGIENITVTESRNGTGKIQLLATNNSNMGEKPDEVLNNSGAKLWII